MEHLIGYLQDFGRKEAVAIGGAVTAVLAGHGIGVAIGDIARAVADFVQQAIAAGARVNGRS